MNILAEFKALKEKLTGLVDDQSKATLATLTDFSAKLTALETGALAQLTTAQAAATELQTKLTGLETVRTDLAAKLSATDSTLAAGRADLLKHLAAIPGHADFKEGGSKANASLADLIAAEQSATNAALAATGVNVKQLPAGGQAPEAAAHKPKNLTEACLLANKKK
jgi:hypothetical protein